MTVYVRKNEGISWLSKVRGHVRVTIKVPISAWIRLQLIAARTATLVTSPQFKEFLVHIKL